MSIEDAFRLDGETAIVTGGNREIETVIVRALADAGADVIVANRDRDAGETAAAAITRVTGTETLAVPADVTDEVAVEAMVGTAVETFGGINVLVNNAEITINTPQRR